VPACLISKSAAQKGSAGAPYVRLPFPSILLADLATDTFRLVIPLHQDTTMASEPRLSLLVQPVASAAMRVVPSAALEQASVRSGKTKEQP